jgi:hypothetical protein
LGSGEGWFLIHGHLLAVPSHDVRKEKLSPAPCEDISPLLKNSPLKTIILELGFNLRAGGTNIQTMASIFYEKNHVQ